LLHLEARFSYEKRMEKVITVFPKTFRILGSDREAIVRAFVEAYPPFDVSGLDNARQFYDCLCSRWRSVSPDPPYVRDVAACEFAYAQIRAGAEHPRVERSKARPPPQNSIRRQLGVVLLRCAHDIRPVFEDDSAGATPVNRDVRLVIGVPPGGNQPQVFEVLAAIFDLLAALDDWTDPATLGTAPEVEQLIGELAQHGLLEVCR
jgi:hypothetical protein